MTRDLITTQEIRVPTDAEIAAEYSRGPVPAHEMRCYSDHCDLAETQELPTVPDTRPAHEWPVSALERYLADIQGRAP